MLGDVVRLFELSFHRFSGHYFHHRCGICVSIHVQKVPADSVNFSKCAEKTHGRG